MVCFQSISRKSAPAVPASPGSTPRATPKKSSSLTVLTVISNVNEPTTDDWIGTTKNDGLPLTVWVTLRPSGATVQLAGLPTVAFVPRLKSKGPVQSKPVSIWQVASQPSPGTRPPSSQVSVPPTPPSPQIPSHTDGLPVQIQPGSTLHDGAQPSPTRPLPSSHPSLAVTTPSPQVSVHTEASSVTREATMPAWENP